MSDIQAIKNGDPAAFENIYRRLHLKLYHFLLARTRSADTAKEVTQLAFIRLWQFRHTLSEEYSIDTQLFTVARTTLLNHMRKLAIQRKHLTVVFNQLSGETPVIAASDQLFEVTDHLQAAIDRLPPVRKKVFMLSRLQGLSNKEIAGDLSISVKTVEDHISKATRFLRSIIALLLIVLATQK